MTDTIFIVVCEDRHIAPRITLHRTCASAYRHVDAFIASYGDAYEWTEEEVDGLERYVVTDQVGDGPRASIRTGTIEP